MTGGGKPPGLAQHVGRPRSSGVQRHAGAVAARGHPRGGRHVPHRCRGAIRDALMVRAEQHHNWMMVVSFFSFFFRSFHRSLDFKVKSGVGSMYYMH